MLISFVVSLRLIVVKFNNNNKIIIINSTYGKCNTAVLYCICTWLRSAHAQFEMMADPELTKVKESFVSS